MHSMLCALCYALYAMHSMLCTLCYALYVVQSMLCNLCYAIYAQMYIAKQNTQKKMQTQPWLGLCSNAAGEIHDSKDLPLARTNPYWKLLGGYSGGYSATVAGFMLQPGGRLRAKLIGRLLGRLLGGGGGGRGARGFWPIRYILLRRSKNPSSASTVWGIKSL